MARPEKSRPRTLEEARIAGLADQSNLGDRIAAIGPWEGESMDEIIEILRGGRKDGRKLPNLL
jgi:hypothetical protein